MGVVAGSMLVPEVVCARTASMRVVGGFMSMLMPFMSMGIVIGTEWFSCVAGFCAGIFRSGMSGILGMVGFVCAWMAGAAMKPNESRADISLGSIRILFVHCVGGRQRRDAARRFRSREDSDSKCEERRGVERLR